ncbi:MAG: glycosyltransferase family 2 protein [Thermodesulfovibrio sp.]|nr:glycosyltransferase family 2 protein [Thermodesulfovibrio sp.]
MKLTIIPQNNIIFDPEKKLYKVTATPARCKLLIDRKESFPDGWFLIKGILKRKGQTLKLKLIFQNDNIKKEQYLPVSCKGTILELIKIPPKTKEIFLELMNLVGEFEIVENFSLKPVNSLERIYRMFRRVLFFFQRRFNYQRKIIGLSYYTPLINLQKAYELANKIRDCESEIDYSEWIERFDKLKQTDIKKIIKDLKKSKINVKFYILIYDNDHIKLNKTISSLEKQLYRNFEFKFLNDKSKAEFERLINLISENAYFIFLKAGIILPIHSLYWIAKEAESSDIDLIYTDHDYIDYENKRFNPCFKPDFSLEYLRSNNYIGFAFAVKAKIISKIENLSIEEIYGYNSHSLLLKIAEKTTPSKIKHIPTILFHFPEQFKINDEILLNKNPVKEHLERLKVSASVERIDSKNYKVIYHLRDKPLISIIVCTKDQFLILKNCIESILEKTTYSNYEIILVDNQSTEENTLGYLKSLLNIPKIKLLNYNKPFNFSAINNFAVTKTNGEVLVFLNNDTEIITPMWLEIMLGCLQQPNVGAVGVKLYYPNGRIQHAGVIVGPGGCADHAFKGLEKTDRGYMDRAIIQQEYSAVTAACMMTWKNLFIKVGGFDEENLPISFNDVDYCLKLKEAGYRIIFTPYVEIYHYESLSRGKDFSYEAQIRSKREADYIRKKWTKYIEYDPFYNPNLNYKRLDFSLNLFPKLKKPWNKNGF